MTNNRLLFDIPLRPTQGSRFAPTGFADLGAATFDRPDDEDGWTSCLLVESAQSMANRFEATLWDQATKAPSNLVKGLPFVEVVNPDGEHLTSSREESHRLASAYVRAAVIGERTGSEWLVEKLGLSDGAPLDYRAIAARVFAIDPLALVHGVFFAGKGGKEFPGQPKFTRLMTGFIEAEDVRRAESGGVKRDIVNHTQASSGGDSTDGYGSIPFGRTEWTARSIHAYVNIDLAQLRSYGLPQPASELLRNLALLELALFLEEPMRLRTNCDLEASEGSSFSDRDGTVLDSSEKLADHVGRLSEQCRSEGLFGERIEMTWSPKN